LGQVEAGRRPGEVLLLGHRHRDRQLVQLHWFTRFIGSTGSSVGFSSVGFIVRISSLLHFIA
jgi:hypothetical protein